GAAGRVELRPPRQTAAVGIAGLREIGPVGLHGRRDLLIDSVVLRGVGRAAQASKYVWHLRSVGCPSGFPAGRGARELELIAGIGARASRLPQRREWRREKKVPGPWLSGVRRWKGLACPSARLGFPQSIWPSALRPFSPLPRAGEARPPVRSGR